MAEWFPGLREILARRSLRLNIRKLRPYPYTRRTLLGSALAALIAGILLGTGYLIFVTVSVTFNALQQTAHMVSETVIDTVQSIETYTTQLLPVTSEKEASSVPQNPQDQKTSSTLSEPAKERSAEALLSLLPSDARIGEQIRNKIHFSPLPFKESGELSISDAVKQVDFALLQTVLRADLDPGRLYFLTSEYRTKGNDSYHLQRLRLYLPENKEQFISLLQENLDVWAERAVLNRESSNKLTLSTEGVLSHEIWLEQAGKEFIPPPTQPGPRITIVIDDMGENPKAAQALLRLNMPVTLAIWPFSRYAEQTANTAHQAGREILIHYPMEPMQSPFIKAGPGELKLSMSAEEIDRLLSSSLSKVPHAAGLNNHMGSRFTSNPVTSAIVCDTLAREGLFVLDSVTLGQSVFYREARQKGLPAYRRSVFLDDGPRTVKSVLKELERTEQLARQHGQAVAIGHPHPETLAALKQWTAERDSSIHIVPLRYLTIPVETMHPDPIRVQDPPSKEKK